MRKLLALSMLANILLCFVIVYISSTMPQVDADCVDEPCTNPPCCNGDVNGDHHIDLSDVIFLLNYLFAEGTEPITVKWSGYPPPATGQTLCYNRDGAIIDCTYEDYFGQDGFYKAGYPMEGRFVDNGDGSVTDNCTGLMWQQIPPSISYRWQDALKYCEDLILAGETDWRLPNVRELESIVDYGRFGPSLDPVFTPGKFGRHWTSTTHTYYTSSAYCIWAGLGAEFYHKRSNLGARAVRTCRKASK